jgi:hypothetical protein
MRDVRKIRSPDEWDAIALTFAEPVRERSTPKPKRVRHVGETAWMGGCV